jgi:sugar phosphate isomerase/epimerase
MAAISLSVQLYTVRNYTAKDMAGTLKKIATIGYKEVELAGFGNATSAAELRAALDDAGLKVTSAHIGIEQFEKDMGKVLADHATLGNKNLVVPWMAAERRGSAEQWKAVAKSLNKIGKTCRKEGFALGYHNHAFEFDWFGKQTAMDILFGSGDPENVFCELDCFWVRAAGFCPVCVINKMAGRVKIVHLKDMKPVKEPTFANVGDGILDLAGIIAAGRKNKAKAYVVEQDYCYEQDSLAAIKNSYRNLMKMGYL